MSPAELNAQAIRPGRDADADGFIALIGACWSQYPGVLLDVDGEMPELRALASYYTGKGGALWAAEHGGHIVGMIATRPHEANAWEICRVYVHPSLHGSGLGHRLLDIAEAHASTAGAQRLVLWSDTRFDRAHRFYEKRSYIRSGPIRVLDDISNSLEFAYAKPVNGVELLDAAAASAAIPRLSEILIACVAEDAAACFTPPLAPDLARSEWQSIAKQVAAGQRVLFGAWCDGVLMGTVSLLPASVQTGAHRAEVARLLVHPAARRRGLARNLLQRLEQEAAGLGRPLLVLRTLADGGSEHVLRETGWQQAGRIPGFVQSAAGGPVDALDFWKRIA